MSKDFYVETKLVSREYSIKEVKTDSKLIKGLCKFSRTRLMSAGGAKFNDAEDLETIMLIKALSLIDDFNEGGVDLTPIGLSMYKDKQNLIEHIIGKITLEETHESINDHFSKVFDKEPERNPIGNWNLSLYEEYKGKDIREWYDEENFSDCCCYSSFDMEDIIKILTRLGVVVYTEFNHSDKSEKFNYFGFYNERTITDIDLKIYIVSYIFNYLFDKSQYSTGIGQGIGWGDEDPSVSSIFINEDKLAEIQEKYRKSKGMKYTYITPELNKGVENNSIRPVFENGVLYEYYSEGGEFKYDAAYLLYEKKHDIDITLGEDIIKEKEITIDEMFRKILRKNEDKHGTVRKLMIEILKQIEQVENK